MEYTVFNKQNTPEAKNDDHDETNRDKKNRKDDRESSREHNKDNINNK